MTEMGHEPPYAPPHLRGRCRSRKRSYAANDGAREMRDAGIDGPIQLGHLDVADREDHPKIVQALYKFLDSTALSGQRRRN